MEEPYFFLEEQGWGKKYSIRLTQEGWDKLSKSEKDRLLTMAAGKAKDSKKWIHGRQSIEAGDWDSLRKKSRKEKQ